MASRKKKCDWKDFQDRVASVLNLVPGCHAQVNYVVHGARNNFQADVWAEFQPIRDPIRREPHIQGRESSPFVFKVIVECKYWKRRVPQATAYALKSQVDEAGAALGLIITQAGVQSGVATYLRNSNNLMALTFAEFQAMLTQPHKCSKPLDIQLGEAFLRTTAPLTACADCGKEIALPFTGADRSILCNDCKDNNKRFLLSSESTTLPFTKLAGVDWTGRKLGPAIQSVIHSSVEFKLLGAKFGSDLESSLNASLLSGAVFQSGSSPLAILHQAIMESIGEIHLNSSAALLPRFLKDGPYENFGDIPSMMKGKRLTDDETASVIKLIHVRMTSCFMGSLAKLLAVSPCLHILRKLQAENRISPEARLFVGDAVWAASLDTTEFSPSADLHILTESRTQSANGKVTIGGVAEVKSRYCSPQLMQSRLKRHLDRGARGLVIGTNEYSSGQITLGYGKYRQAAVITVLPSRWTLPRKFWFEEKNERKFLHIDDGIPPYPKDSIERHGPTKWQVTLRWSQEALSAVAYEMTFWFLEKLGEVIYAAGVPREWKKMTAAQAGQNAAKMMLYYAILRCRTPIEEQRAIALYNTYGFGYALGMNFRNKLGLRKMLWVQDLNEIIANGCTKTGCKIV